MAQRCLLALVLAVLLPLAASAESVEVTFDRGLVSIQCRNAPLSNVFEELEKVADVELILEDEVKSKRLTAELIDVPVAMAVQRLLEGMGVNYAVMMDPRDWGRVDKVFVGAGGGGPSRPAPPPRRAPVRPPAPEPADDYENFDDTEDTENVEEYDDYDTEDMEDEMIDDPTADPEAFPPPGSSPIPSYLPPQQSFPRSSFTPGLPNNQQQPQQQQQQPANPSNPPPATFPFMDALGRPIPVPPNMNQQQERQRQRQQQQQQQQK